MLLRKDYEWFLIELSIFDFSSNFTVRTCKNFQLLNYHRVHYLFIKKAPSQAKDLINMVSVTPEVLWMVSNRIVDYRFIVKFHMSEHAKIFSF